MHCGVSLSHLFLWALSGSFKSVNAHPHSEKHSCIMSSIFFLLFFLLLLVSVFYFLGKFLNFIFKPIQSLYLPLYFYFQRAFSSFTHSLTNTY